LLLIIGPQSRAERGKGKERENGTFYMQFMEEQRQGKAEEAEGC
jgi:hypothetical protein